MKAIKKRQVVIAIPEVVTKIIYHPVEEQHLAIESMAAYYKIETSEVFDFIKMPDNLRARQILFYILRTECKMDDNQIGHYCNTSRQLVYYHIEKFCFEKDIYLRILCDYKKVLVIFRNLRKEQEEWFQQHSQSNNTTL